MNLPSSSVLLKHRHLLPIFGWQLVCRYNAVRFTYVFFTSILLGLAFWQVGQDRCGASTLVRSHLHTEQAQSSRLLAVKHKCAASWTSATAERTHSVQQCQEGLLAQVCIWSFELLR